MKKYIAIDIGGTKTKYGIIDENGNILEFNETSTNAELGGEYILKNNIKICNSYIQNLDIKGVCISTAGIVNSDTGEIIYANKSIPDYIGINHKKVIEKEFNLLCEVENDVNCAGLCESFIGASKGAEISVCLTVGTGIGGCIILNKKIFSGFSSSACEVGYMNILGNEFQNSASTTTLVDNVKNKLCIEEINGKEIFERAKNGDKICIEEIDNLCNILGLGIANICYILNPQIVVLGGGIMEQREYLGERIKKSLEKNLMAYILKNTELRFAQNGNKAGMLGAYYNFLQKHKI